MKKLLSLMLSVLMMTSAMTFFPAKAEEAPAAEQNTAQKFIGTITVQDDDLNSKITTLASANKTIEYKGISFDIETSTLKLNNARGENLWLSCTDIPSMTVEITGTCALRNISFHDCVPTFTGSGILNLNSRYKYSCPLVFDNMDIMDGFGDTIPAVTVSDTVDINIYGENYALAEFCIRTENENGIDTGKLFSYSGTISQQPVWEKGKVAGGPFEELEMYRTSIVTYDPPCILVRTRFPAEKILRKAGSDEENNYYVHLNYYSPYYNNFTAKLLERDGIWYSAYDNSNLYPEDDPNSQYTFEEYGKDGIKDLPSTLVDKDGYATANLYLTYNSQLWTKGGEKYIFCLGDINLSRNTYVEPVDPPALDKENFHIFKLCSKDGFYWFEYQESHYVPMERPKDSELEDIEDWEEHVILKKAGELGYEESYEIFPHPYYHTYYLKNKNLSFSSGAAKTVDLGACTVSGIKSKTYTGKAIKQKLNLTYLDKTLEQGKDYTVSYKNNKNAGKASVTLSGKGGFAGKVKQTFKINKAANPMTAQAKTKTVKAEKLKTAKQTVKNAITVKKNQGSLTFERLKKGSSAKLTVSKKGIITVAKGKYKKGSVLKINVKVTAKGSSNYKSGTKTVKVKLKVS